MLCIHNNAYGAATLEQLTLFGVHDYMYSSILREGSLVLTIKDSVEVVEDEVHVIAILVIFRYRLGFTFLDDGTYSVSEWCFKATVGALEHTQRGYIWN